MPNRNLVCCHCCGLIQHKPQNPDAHEVRCVRCRSKFKHGSPARNTVAGILAVSALAFYLPAMLLPMLKIEKLGHASEDSLLNGVISMLSNGYLFVGIVVLLFSIVFPLFKLVTIVLLCLRAVRSNEHKAIAYHAVEYLGRWGMMDVMLVSILVAFVKLGDLVEIHAGKGIIAFSVMVLLSLISGLVFDPHMMWEEEVKDEHT